MEVNILHNIDCLDYMRKLRDKSVRCIITDPPYGINYRDNIRKSRYWSKNNKKGEFLDLILNDDGSINFDLVFDQMFRILEDNSAIYITTRHDVYPDWFYRLENSGFSVKNVIVWSKGDNGYGDLKGNFGNANEFIIYAVKGRHILNPVFFKNKISKRLPNVWDDIGKTKKSEYIGVPTQKPIALFKRCIELSTNKGELVFDPFMGSGTLAVACIQTNRDWVGCELDKATYEKARKRIDDTIIPLFY